MCATEKLCDMLEANKVSYTTMLHPRGMVVIWTDTHGNEWRADGAYDDRLT